MTAQLQTSGWSRDYLAFMRCDAGDNWLPDAESQVHSWLAGRKDLDVDLHADGDVVDGDRTVTVRRLENGPARDLKVTLVEPNTPTGTWTTELVVHDERGSEDWIYLSVTNDEGRFVATPRLARYLMQVLPLGDGSLSYVDAPQVFRADQVERLIEVLSDQRRHGLVFVAGTDDRIPIDAFMRQVDDWAAQVYGLAQVIVLDAEATREFHDRVGVRLATPAWTIRTYRPGVDFSDPSDGRRHRILGTERLAGHSEGRIRFLLGEIARSHASERQLPSAVVRVLRRFERVENRRLLDVLQEPDTAPESEVIEAPSVAPAPVVEDVPKSPDPVDPESRTQLRLVKQILNLKEITESGLRDIAGRLTRHSIERANAAKVAQRLEDLQTQVEGLRDGNSELLEALQEEQLEHEVTRLDLDALSDRNKWLEDRLKALGDYEPSYAATPAEFIESRPRDFGELLDRIEAMKEVEFTGDSDAVIELEAVDGNNAALRTAWDAVLALADYVRSRADGQCDQSLSHYLRHTPTGYRTFPPGKFAETETGETMKRFGAERQFPVPTSYDPDGQAMMKAHFKLAKIGPITPRMHVLDGNPKQPIVFIGYIGPHLTNTKTRSM
ncbi:hypothetical protein ATK17_2371 [Branchiibius hedensis]|uniref:Uncharacterized protein n=1 Tax=Branchiibius hedensis TaxID=672460 RepID=A0A2Y8ZU51_9MICO|nr:hypothetical protein [Branchiibius hedensis]PWJ26224.1 hypothetical protein ATK17_2371 [Branchiibius hedensis]SSA35036.1 hypothetical protein SAMN04489750_2371 [Branchiibius hedensis]